MIVPGGEQLVRSVEREDFEAAMALLQEYYSVVLLDTRG